MADQIRMKPTPTISLIVAQGRNRVIGADGAIPWHLSTDFAHFKAVTLGKPVIMGRKTWQSLPKRPLPGRLNIVVSRDPAFGPIQGLVVSSVELAVETAKAHCKLTLSADEVCVIGGAEIYAQALPLADRLWVTDVDASPKGDALFPEIDPEIWQIGSEVSYPAGPKDDHAFTIRSFNRR
jgi:dihydrofolate reductase